ncbi:uncharacterized protein LOC108109775 isoform X2 [Drosophila eugracilis]|uniref:uncharacterized protein LOC108109775 isoform X2 n=1 Tax=Drosophila eugracilis TaxID=29029 RepID=UPI0007E5C0A3|nr:uncharacterized protein LOC108109775 isoform X2 [Drosophila eugracilis]
MSMIEPSEELLDRHFQQQVATYKDVDQSRAAQSDRLIMARWMEVFEKTTSNEKLARNSLMLLMHGHLNEFGFLKEPFTDEGNCSRNLNEVLNEYRGKPCMKISSLMKTKKKKSTTSVAETQPIEKQGLVSGRSVSRVASLKTVLRPKKLDPIEEVSETLEKSSSDANCSECAIEAGKRSVRQRIQSLEEKLSKNEQHPFSKCSMKAIRNVYSSRCGDSVLNRDQVNGETERTGSSSSTTDEKLKKLASVIEQVTRRSSAVKSLKNCFEEMSERLRHTSDSEYVTTEPEPENPSSVPRRSLEPILVTRLTGGQTNPPNVLRDKTIEQLLTRRENLRVECLKYYNLDGTMKDVKDMPFPLMNSKGTEIRFKGFLIGAYRALERLKRWHGRPNKLKFFKTFCRGFGLNDFGRLQALDRRFELAALKWHRHKVLVCQRNTWHRYRRSILVDQPPFAMKDLIRVRHQLEMEEELQQERMVHLAKIKELCKTNCCGVLRPDIHQKMLNNLDDEIGQLLVELKSLIRKKEILFH